MKKRLTALFLAAVTCLVGHEAGEIRSAQANASVRRTSVDAYVDLSGQVIQEGGALSEASISDVKPRTADTEDEKKRQVQEALLKAWDSVSDSCNLSSYHISPELLRSVYFDTLNQYPRYFYVKSGYGLSYSNDWALKVEIRYTVTDRSALPQMIEAYDNAVAGIKRSADPSWSDMEKALYIHDYLARNCEYDTSYSSHSAYDALVGRKAVCQGYTLAFKELAQQLGLSSEIVTSDELNHAWNMVRVNGSYYHVDVTWDDPVTNLLGRVQHRYFMKSSDDFMSEEGRHASSDWKITGGVHGAAAADTRYDAYFWNGVDVGFDQVQGAWYGFDGRDSIDRFVCSGTEFASAEELVQVADVWPVIGETRHYWQDKFVGTGCMDGKLYYSGACDIYELDVQTKAHTPVFSLTERQKSSARIYGMHITPSGGLRYLLSKSPKEEGRVYGVGSYWIVFDGNGAQSGSMGQMDALKIGQQYRLPENRFQKEGYAFVGWNSKPDGTGDFYAPQALFYQDAGAECAQLILYAQWKIEPETEEDENKGEKVDGRKETYVDKEGLKALIKFRAGAGNPGDIVADVDLYTGEKDWAGEIEIKPELLDLIREEAGQNVQIVLRAKDENDADAFQVQADAKVFVPGSQLFVYQRKGPAGGYCFVNAGPYTVGTGGGTVISGLENKVYELVDAARAQLVNQEILDTVALKKTQIALKKKGSKMLKFADGLDMENVEAVVYQTSKKKIAAVAPNGKVTGKKAGTANIEVAVTLKNGDVKTVSCKVRVK